MSAQEQQLFQEYMAKARAAKAININEIIFKYRGKLRAPKGDLKIGEDFVPPMNTIPLNIGSVAKTKFKADKTVIPDNFSWANPEDVKKYKPGIPADFITPPLNQALCGSCWAFSSASVLSDRWAIANKQKSPNLSPSFLLSCDNKPDVINGLNNLKCEGGVPALAMEFARNKGVVPLNCQSYEWCLGNKKCDGASVGAGSDVLNRFVPSCQQHCIDYESKDGIVQPVKSESPFNTLKVDAWPKDEVGQSTFYSVEIPAAKTFIGKPQQVIADIKSEVWNRGPVVSTFQIFEDFFLKDLWYQGKEGPIYFRDYSKKYASRGFHAVAIVGWGTDVDKDGKSFGYWIIRNSWGDNWNEKGYFRAAFTDLERKHNVDTGFDTAIGLDKQQQGLCGVVAPFVVATSVVEPVKAEKEETKTEETKVEGGLDNTTQNNNRWMIWVFIAIMIAVVAYYVFYKK